MSREYISQSSKIHSAVVANSRFNLYTGQVTASVMHKVSFLTDDMKSVDSDFKNDSTTFTDRARL